MMFPSHNTQRGQAMIIAAIFFLFISMAFLYTTAGPVLEQVNTTDDISVGKSAYYASEAGTEDAVFRIKRGYAISGSEVITIGDATATTTINDITGGKQIIALARERGLNRNGSTTLSSGVGSAFFYGMQVGAGGVTFNNSSSVTGNLYSNGPISGSGNIIRGNVVSAGPAGSISGITATGSAWAHSISNSTIYVDAYYGCATLPATCFTSNTVSGTKYPNSPDLATTSFPIPDSQISAWEASASSTSVYSGACPYNITGNVTLNAQKIPCDLNISNNAIVTVTGPIWVVGNIRFSNNAQVRVSSTLGPQSVPLIADNPSNRLTSSTVILSNSTLFSGSGNANSYIMLVSMNNSAELGGSVKAIEDSNGSTGALLLYAPHGLIKLSNSAAVREVTGYKVEVNNSANIIYQTGLADLVFNSGPGGGYVINTWIESQ